MPNFSKILHCPENCGNIPWNLSRAERKIGFKSDLAVFETNQFYQGSDISIQIKGLTLPNEFKRLGFLRWAIKHYDVFHFNYGSSIWDHPLLGLNYLDFYWIKKAGKKIVITFQGDDARQKDFFIKNFGWGPYEKKYSLLDKFKDVNRRRRIKKVERFADAIFALNPDFMYVLPEKTQFLPYASPEISKIRPIKTRSKGKIKILHAPSDRLIKGTDEIVRTIKKLSKKYPIELVLIENLPHKEALSKYAEADIAIDQLRIGWYGSFGVEAMAFGLPLVCFLRSKDLEKFVPFHREIPIVSTEHKNLEDILMFLIENPIIRHQIGLKSRSYVEKYHNPIEIAKKVSSVY